MFNNVMGKAQENIKKMQDIAENLTVTAESGAGMVKVTMNGNGKILKVEIENSAYESGKLVVGDLFMAATNTASNKAKEAMQQEMKNIMGNLGGIPASLMAMMPWSK